MTKTIVNQYPRKYSGFFNEHKKDKLCRYEFVFLNLFCFWDDFENRHPFFINFFFQNLLNIS